MACGRPVSPSSFPFHHLPAIIPPVGSSVSPWILILLLALAFAGGALAVWLARALARLARERATK